MAKIGLLQVDGKLPNLALMKISAYHKSVGDNVEFYNPFDDFDIVYKSKIFTFSNDYDFVIKNAKEIRRGGTGYEDDAPLPDYIDKLQPDYDLYPASFWPKDTAIGFLTRGCIRKCPWCIVPRKEGKIRPYMDITEITQNGRFKKAVLFDNNILAAGKYGIEQLEKIAYYGIMVDFNQALDARLVTKENAYILASIKWINNYIRFGCDTTPQIKECERAIKLIRDAGYTKDFMLYCILKDDFSECFDRVSYFRGDKKIAIYAPPFQDFVKKREPPMWQKDLAHWCNKRQLFFTCDFKDFEPRVGFKCKYYIDTLYNKKK